MRATERFQNAVAQTQAARKCGYDAAHKACIGTHRGTFEAMQQEDRAQRERARADTANDWAAMGIKGRPQFANEVSTVSSGRKPGDALEQFYDAVNLHAIANSRTWSQAHSICRVTHRALWLRANQRTDEGAARRTESNRDTRAKSDLIGFANEFSLLQDPWIQVSPKGDFPHGKGKLQRVDDKAIQEMVANFREEAATLGADFAGLPIYVGHPDAAGISGNYPDKSAYGWIIDLQGRPDGLYGNAKWSDAGRSLVKNAQYKFYSPYWSATESIEGGKSIARPVYLVSLGLTNTPNIPVKPLANDALSAGRSFSLPEVANPREAIDLLPAEVMGLLGLANEATDYDRYFALYHKAPKLASRQRQTVFLGVVEAYRAAKGLSYDAARKEASRFLPMLISP